MGSVLPDEFFFGEPFLQAAETCRRLTVRRARQIETGSEPLAAHSSVPIDNEIAKLTDQGKRIPLVLKPQIKGSQAWTADLQATIYRRVEAAFNAAGIMLGQGRGEYRRELVDICHSIELKLERATGDVIELPLSFASRLNRAFREGILPNRRAERSYFLRLKIGSSCDERRFEFLRDEVKELIGLIENDLARLKGMCRGRSPDLRKIIFVRRLAAFWIELTGRPPQLKALSRFDMFLKASWRTGFEREQDLTDDFFARAMAYVKQSG